jgi:NAD dependent epimerase/dehydratase
MVLKDKSVLVTGADGFIGSRLVEELVARGARVTALAQYNSFNHWGWLEDIPALDRVRVVTGDVRDAHFCETLVRDIEVIFHLAALIPIPYSYIAPDSYVDTNIRGTLNLCQAARAAGVKKMIHTSTSEVYGTARCVPMDESHPLTPQSPYSATKIGADCMALSFYYSFEFPVVIERPFNCYGPRQSARAVIPTIIAQIASGVKEVQLGDLETTRDFTYVVQTIKPC